MSTTFEAPTLLTEGDATTSSQGPTSAEGPASLPLLEQDSLVNAFEGEDPIEGPSCVGVLIDSQYMKINTGRYALITKSYPLPGI
jgi:hypothetical protein